METKEKQMSNELNINTEPAGTNNVQFEVPREEVIIKRYQNRKLYDTKQSCYVSLEDVRSLIKEGYDIWVIDNKTKQDITAMTLLQAFYEMQKKKIQTGAEDAPRLEDLKTALKAM